jgi:hypothetical protein
MEHTMFHPFKKHVLFWAPVILLFACKFPYEPHPEEPVIPNNPITSNESGVKIKEVVPGMQICNPSISLDTINFPACMLWLNFAGTMPVKTNNVTSAYPLFAKQHDRLTISDSSNTVRWFIMRDIFTDNSDIQFQDPEWSTHPEYIGTLLGDVNSRNTWSFYAIHPKSSNYIKLINSRLNETSTPHLWVDRNSNYQNLIPSEITYNSNGLLNKRSVNDFFGTSKLKIIYSITENGYLSLYYIDYTSDSVAPVKLSQVSDQNGKSLNYESALISPDGNWIVFNAFETSTHYSSYIQKLAPNSRPILIKEGASDPHWWTNPNTNQLNIIFSETNGDNRVFADLSDPTYSKTGDAGKTYLQKVSLTPQLPSALAVEFGDATVLVNLPLKGGLSPDGHFLCTGYNYAYIIELF